MVGRQQVIMPRTIHRMTTTTITKIMIKIIKAPVHIGAEISNPMLKRYQWQSWKQTPREKSKMQLIENKSITCTACTGWFFPQHRGSSISSCAKSPRMFKFADLFLNTSILSDRGRTLCECKSCAILRRHLDGETLRSAG